MARPKSGLFDQREYVNRYHRETITRKNVTFNRKKPDDMALLEWAEKQTEGFVAYVKRLIREDMEGKRRERPLPYLVEEVIEIDEGSEGHSFPKFCPTCGKQFGLFYPPKFCPSCSQRIDTEHGKSIGTRTVNKREYI